MTHFGNQYIFTDQFYYRSFSDQLTAQSLKALLGMKERYAWLGYLTTPVILLLKISFTAICVSIGAVLLTVGFSFRMVFKAAMVAETVFIIAQVFYLINLWQHADALTLESAPNYYPLTVLSWVGVENAVSWLHYPLQTLNLFELVYIAVLSWLLAGRWKPDFVESLSIVLPSYATGLILWMVLVTFLTLQVS